MGVQPPGHLQNRTEQPKIADHGPSQPAGQDSAREHGATEQRLGFAQRGLCLAAVEP